MGQDLFIFSGITVAMFDFTSGNIPVIRYMFKEVPESRGGREEFNLVAEPNTAVFNPIVEGEGGETNNNSVALSLNEEVSPEEIASAADKANLVSGISAAAGVGTESVALIGSIFSFDQSGAMLKFSQMSKLFARYRMLNMNFGSILGTYFSVSAKKYDKPSEEGTNYIINNSKGSKAKFTAEEIPLTVFEFGLIKAIIYITSCLVKLAAKFLLNKSKAKKEIKPGMCKFINIQQKLHFVAFNIFVLDMIYFGMRTIIHTTLGPLPKILTFIGLAFVLYDIVEIWILSSTSDVEEGADTQAESNTSSPLD